MAIPHLHCRDPSTLLESAPLHGGFWSAMMHFWQCSEMLTKRRHNSWRHSIPLALLTMAENQPSPRLQRWNPYVPDPHCDLLVGDDDVRFKVGRIHNYAYITPLRNLLSDLTDEPDDDYVFTHQSNEYITLTRARGILQRALDSETSFRNNSRQEIGELLGVSFPRFPNENHPTALAIDDPRNAAHIPELAPLVDDLKGYLGVLGAYSLTFRSEMIEIKDFILENEVQQLDGIEFVPYLAISSFVDNSEFGHLVEEWRMKSVPGLPASSLITPHAAPGALDQNT